MYIYSDTAAGLLYVETEAAPGSCRVTDPEGTEIPCPCLRAQAIQGGFRSVFDASRLTPWSPDTPALYLFEADGRTERFGHVTIRAHQNTAILLNGAPVYIRGYIRGIVAHDHPNMTGGSAYDAAVKNIRQAKKYGFNEVRFHSTVPPEDFVRAADELGMLIHMEIGFAYEYDDQGHKKNLSMSNDTWRETLLRYRNHPSVAVFAIGNELHNAGRYPEVRALYEQGRALAPSKLIMDNSGWGEYDRSTADVYSQHIAYYFPYGVHRDMFRQDFPWYMNGGVAQQPLETDAETAAGSVHVHRECVPIRPVISHEAMHYIDIPDYEAYGRKFDAFLAAADPEYLKANRIEKPWYFEELQKLIRRKGLSDLMPDYIAGSRAWKLMATKIFLERLRLSALCGYEMLQFADCYKYENKNGIVDCFDDDKGIDPAWLRQSNDDLVLLCDYDSETVRETAPVTLDFYASDFLPRYAIRGTLRVCLDGECVYEGQAFALAGGLQKLCRLTLTPKALGQAAKHEIAAEFVSDGLTVRNSWPLWTYPAVHARTKPEMKLENAALTAYLAAGTPDDGLYLTDTLDEAVFERLAAGKMVILNYAHLAERNTWQLPGALERFKPCIWDRGSNLGGVIRSEKLQKALAAGQYFDQALYPLLEAGYKVCLVHFPVLPEEFVQGIDKPVRDRMKGLLQGIGDFIDDDTLRRFAHLFSLRVGAGLLIVCGFNLQDPENPVTASFLSALLDDPAAFDTDRAVAPEAFRALLEETNAAGIRPEDTMNHFWEIDNKPVEDTLFWEEAGINLAGSRA